MVIRRRLQLTGLHVAFVTATVKDWLSVFSQDNAALVAIEELKRTADIYSALIFGYVIMPSHVHFIISFQEIEKLSKFVQCFKSVCSRRIRNLGPLTYHEILSSSDKFHLWKPRFDDFIIRDQKQFETKLNYIHENPVRAGLVEKAIDYRYSSAKDWLTNTKGLIEINTNLEG
jgi:putative transposase